MAKSKQQNSPKQLKKGKKQPTCVSRKKRSVTKPGPTKEQIKEASQGLKSLKKSVVNLQRKNTILDDSSSTHVDQEKGPIAVLATAMRGLSLKSGIIIN